MATEDLVIRIQGDATEITRALEDVGAELKSVTTAVKSTDKAIAQINKNTDSWGSDLLKLSGAISVVQTAYSTFKGAIDTSVGAFIKQDDAINRVKTSLRLIGQQDVQAAVDGFAEFADQLQLTANVEGETSLQLISIAKALRLSDSQAKAFIETSADLAAVTGKDIKQSFDGLIASLKGESGELSKLAPELKNLTEQQLKQGEAVKVLGDKFSGFAAEQSKTIQGQLKRVENLYANTFKTIGGLFATLFRLDNQDLAIAALQAIDTRLKALKPTVEDIRKSIDEFVSRIVNGFMAISDSASALKAILVPLGATIILAFGPSAIAAVASFATALKAASISATLLAAKFTLIVGAVTAVSAAIEIMIRNFSDIDKIGVIVVNSIIVGFRKLGEFIVQVGSSIVDAMVGVGKAIGQIFSVENLKRLFTGGGDVFSSIADGARAAFAKTFQQLRKSSDQLVSEIKSNSNKLDFGVTGKALQSINEFMGGFNKELVVANTNQKEFTGNVAASASAFQGVSKEGQTAIEALKKKIDELMTKQSELSQNQISVIDARAASEMKNLDLLQKQLSTSGALNASTQQLLATARSLVEANKGAEIAKAQKEALDNIIEQNKELRMEVESIGSTQQENLDRQLARQLEIIDQQWQELKLKGLLNSATEKELRIKESLTKERTAKLKEQAPTQIQESLQIGGQVLGKSITDAFGPLLGFTSGVGAVVSAAQAVVDAVPNMLDSISNLINSITDLPLRIMNSLNKVFESVLRFFAEFPKNLITAISGIIRGFTEFLTELPKAIGLMLAELPGLLISFLDDLPAMIEDFVAAFVAQLPMIAISLVEFLVRDAPRIALKLVEVLAIRLPIAIIKGVISAFKEVITQIRRVLTGQRLSIFDPKMIEKNIQTALKKLSGSASRIFEVTDLAQQAKAAQRAKDIVDQVDEAARKAGKTLWETWISKVVNWFKDRGREIWEGFLKPIANWFGDRGTEIWNGFLKPILNWFGDRGTEIWDGFLKPIADFFGKAGTAIWEGFIVPIGDFFINSGMNIWNGLMQLANAAFNFFGQLGTAIWNGFLLPIANFFGDMGTDIWRGFVKPIGDFFGSIGAEIWFGFLRPIGNWFGDMGTSLWNGFKSAISGLGDLGTQIWRGLLDAAAGIGEFGTRIWKGLLEGLNDPASFANAGMYIWQGLRDGIMGAGDFFGDIGTSIWNGLKAGLSTIGRVIDDSLRNLNPANLFERIFKIDYKGQGRAETTLKIDIPFANFATGGYVQGQASVPGDSRINDKILALLSPGEAIISREMLANPVVKSVINAILAGKINPQGYAFGGKIGGTFAKVVSGDIKGAAADVANLTPSQIAEQLKSPAKLISDAIQGLDPSQLWKLVEKEFFDNFMKVFEQNRFATGGLVGDTVPSLLQPGEFVMSRQGVSAAGVDNLRALNSGRVGGQTVINYNIELPVTIENKGTPIDANFVRQRILPTLKEELKRESIDGKFIVSRRGIRNE